LALTLPFGGVPTKSSVQPNGCKAAAFKFFRALAKELGLEKSQYTLHYNPCGDWGEASFHTDKMYVSANFDQTPGSELGVLVRSCNGIKDYVGGHNNWLTVEEATLENVLALYKRICR
jgi:hypothetical protein